MEKNVEGALSFLRGKFTLACSVWMCLKAGVVVVVVAVVAGVQLLLWK